MTISAIEAIEAARASLTFGAGYEHAAARDDRAAVARFGQRRLDQGELTACEDLEQHVGSDDVGDVGVVEGDDAVVGPEQAGDDVEAGRLAGAVRAEEAHGLTAARRLMEDVLAGVDALEMRRGIRERQYDNRYTNVPPLVPRYRRRPVRGRHLGELAGNESTQFNQRVNAQ